jgi:hypothetical protein
VFDFGRGVVDGAFNGFASFVRGIAHGGASVFERSACVRSGLLSVCAGLIGFSLAARSQTQSRRSGDGE